jgi:hypothetical protein
VIWPSLYERQRLIILVAGMIAVKGRVQREGEVVHLVANHLTDLSADLAGVGDRDDGFPLPHGSGDEFHHGSPGIDPRSLPPKVPKARDIYVPDLHIDSIKVKTRDLFQVAHWVLSTSSAHVIRVSSGGRVVPAEAYPLVARAASWSSPRNMPPCVCPESCSATPNETASRTYLGWWSSKMTGPFVRPLGRSREDPGLLRDRSIRNDH